MHRQILFISIFPSLISLAHVVCTEHNRSELLFRCPKQFSLVTGVVKHSHPLYYFSINSFCHSIHTVYSPIGFFFVLLFNPLWFATYLVRFLYCNLLHIVHKSLPRFPASSHAGNCIFASDTGTGTVFLCVNLNIHFSCLHLFILHFSIIANVVFSLFSGHRFSFSFFSVTLPIIPQSSPVLHLLLAPFWPSFGLLQEVLPGSSASNKISSIANCNFQMPPVHRIWLVVALSALRCDVKFFST